MLYLFFISFSCCTLIRLVSSFDFLRRAWAQRTNQSVINKRSEPIRVQWISSSSGKSSGRCAAQQGTGTSANRPGTNKKRQLRKGMKKRIAPTFVHRSIRYRSACTWYTERSAETTSVVSEQPCSARKRQAKFPSVISAHRMFDLLWSAAALAANDRVDQKKRGVPKSARQEPLTTHDWRPRRLSE